MNDLVEKATDRIYNSEIWSAFWTRKEARRLAMIVIDATLEHFSDPANVTQRMDHAAWDDAQTLHETRPIKTVIAAAMKAAKEKLSSDIKPKSTHPG